MTGVSRSLFVPLSLAVGFAMIASFLLSSSLVPVLSVWLLGAGIGTPTGAHADDWVERLRDRLARMLQRLAPCARPARRGVRRWSTVGDRRRRRADARPRDLSRRAARTSSSFASARRPARSSSPPSGSRGDVLDEIKRAAGPDNVDITLGYVGVQPSSYPINTIFLWTGGSHEGVLQVALKPDARARPRATSRRSCAAGSRSGFRTRSSRSSPATSSAAS